MFEEVVIGALANLMSDVLSATARQLGARRRVLGVRRHSADLDLATYFDTYTFTQDAAPGLARRLAALIGSAETDAVTQRLTSDRCHALLHELLAARLSDAPEQQLERLRDSFRRALWPLVDLDRDAARRIADVAFEYLDGKLSEVVARLESSLPEAAGRLRDRAIGHRIVAILDAIERHQAAIAEDGDQAADQELLRRYKRHLVEEFGTITPPDLEQRRRIPIAHLYVAPKIAPIPPDEAGGEEDPRSSPQPLLTEFAAAIDRAVLLGDPGAGKTTAARALMHAHATVGRRTPFLVTLRDFAADGPITGSFVQYLERVMNATYQCPPPRGWIRRHLLDGAALVIFDGLDELVDTARRAEISNVIEHFCVEYPLARVLVTSRFVGYDQARLDERDFMRFRIDRFDDEQVAEYVGKWFASDSTLTAAQAGRDAAAFVAESASVPDLRSNPLMLSLMCVLYRGEGYIPEHRVQVYRLCADLLFHRWDAARHIHVALALNRSQVLRLLRALAYWLLTRADASTAVTERQLVVKTGELLLARDAEDSEYAEAAAIEFVAFCRGRGWILVDVGTTAAGEPLYSFAHRTFLEYFAAAYLATEADTPEALARTLLPRLVRSQWDIIAQLAIVMKDEAITGGGQRVLQALLKDRRYTSASALRNLVLLAASCLDAVDLTPDYVRTLTRRALEYILEPESDREARDAVLAWSRLNVRRQRELVAAEFKARAETLIASDDPQTRAAGFYLAAWNVRAVNAKVENPQSDYWEAWARGNAVVWRDAIVGDAMVDLATLHLAVERELLTVRDVLEQPAGMARLATAYHNPVTGFLYGSWLGWHGHDVRISPAGDGSSSQACVQLGEYLLEATPKPPFTGPTSWVTVVSDAYAGGELSGADTVPEPVYLAVAVMTAIEIESRMLGNPPGTIAALLTTDSQGWLGALTPYIRRRLTAATTTKEPTPLAALPVREDYQRLFEAWACRRVDFTHPSVTDAVRGIATGSPAGEG